MKKILVLLTGISCVGCVSPNTIKTVYREDVYYRPSSQHAYIQSETRYRPRRFNRDELQIQMAESQIRASQMNQLVGGVMGPNPVSGFLLQYQNANRNINAAMQNPTNTYFAIRNYWQ